MPRLPRLLVGAVALAAMAFTLPMLAPAAASSRDPLQQPFSSTSIWNMPTGSGAALVPAHIAPPSIKTLTLDQTFVIQHPTAPLTSIVQNGGQHSDTCTATGGVLATVPIPTVLVVPAS